MPPLLKPMRLITASSSTRRNRRGRGLPGCGRGVTVPSSAKPKPSRPQAAGAAASLSKPAASPIGVGKAQPQHGAREARVVRRGAGEGGRGAGQAERQAVGRLGIEPAQDRRAELAGGRADMACGWADMACGWADMTCGWADMTCGWADMTCGWAAAGKKSLHGGVPCPNACPGGKPPRFITGRG